MRYGHRSPFHGNRVSTQGWVDCSERIRLRVVLQGSEVSPEKPTQARILESNQRVYKKLEKLRQDQGVRKLFVEIARVLNSDQRMDSNTSLIVVMRFR